MALLLDKASSLLLRRCMAEFFKILCKTQHNQSINHPLSLKMSFYVFLTMSYYMYLPYSTRVAFHLKKRQSHSPKKFFATFICNYPC